MSLPLLVIGTEPISNLAHLLPQSKGEPIPFPLPEGEGPYVWRREKITPFSPREKGWG
jgi:hypothetical protein